MARKGQTFEIAEHDDESMRTPSDPQSPESPESTRQWLEALGLSSREASTYSALLHGPKTEQDIADDLRLHPGAISQAVHRLTRMGAVKRLPGKVPRFALIDPSLVLPALIRQRDDEIAKLRVATAELTRLYRIAYEGSGHEDYIEVVVGREAVLTQYWHLVDSARHELLALTKLPVIEPGNPAVRRALDRGIKTRVIWDRELLEKPGALDDAMQWAESGEEIRSASDVPAKILIVDQRSAVIEVSEASGSGPTRAGLLTRHPELVTSLSQLFEKMWQQSLPLEATQDIREALPLQRRELIACLAAGMTDPAIQRSLGVSRRTLSRRINDLMREHSVQTRFQLGFKLASQSESSSN